MKLSELQQLFTKVQSFAQDVEVVFQAAETEAETVITDLGIHLDPNSATPTGKLVVTHGAAPSPAPTPEPETDPNAGESDDPNALAAS